MFFGYTEKSWWWINIKLGHLIQKKSRIILMPKIPQNYDGFKVSEKSNWCWLMCLEAYVLYNQLALLIPKPTQFTWWQHHWTLAKQHANLGFALLCTTIGLTTQSDDKNLNLFTACISISLCNTAPFPARHLLIWLLSWRM